MSVCRAESYETEESSRYVVTVDEERERQLVRVTSYPSQCPAHPMDHNRYSRESMRLRCARPGQETRERKDGNGGADVVPWLAVQRSCETTLEEEEEAGVESDEEGAEAGKAGGEACPGEVAAGEAERSQAPAAVQRGKLELTCTICMCHIYSAEWEQEKCGAGNGRRRDPPCHFWWSAVLVTRASIRLWRMLYERRTFLGYLSPTVSLLHAGRKASTAARVNNADKAAPIKEGGNDSKAGALVSSKGAKKGKEAEEAMTAMEVKKGKKATAKKKGKKAIVKEPAATQAAPGKPRTPSRRTRKPSAVVVGHTRHA